MNSSVLRSRYIIVTKPENFMIDNIWFTQTGPSRNLPSNDDSDW